MAKYTQTIIQELVALAGGSQVVTDPEILRRQAVDYVGYRNYERFHKQCFAIVPISPAWDQPSWPSSQSGFGRV